MTTRAPEVSFIETMRGTVASPDGGESTPIELEVYASAASAREFRRNGWVELRGLVRAPRWSGEAPAHGSLRITPRALTYQLRFRDRTGALLELTGIKHPSVLAPLRAMTEMHAEVRDADARVIAQGSMRFDLSELAEFLLSWIAWLPSSRRARLELDARRRASERSSRQARPGPAAPALGTLDRSAS